MNWQIRHAAKSISFWVESGDQEYQAPSGTQDILEEVTILNADDLSKTDFACYFNPFFEVRPLKISVGDKKLTLKPVNGEELRFRDIRMIKYGNSDNEPNLCGGAFGYKVKSVEKNEN